MKIIPWALSQTNLIINLNVELVQKIVIKSSTEILIIVIITKP